MDIKTSCRGGIIRFNLRIITGADVKGKYDNNVAKDEVGRRRISIEIKIGKMSIIET